MPMFVFFFIKKENVSPFKYYMYARNKKNEHLDTKCLHQYSLRMILARNNDRMTWLWSPTILDITRLFENGVRVRIKKWPVSR